jgi:hypothetical protein
MSISSISTFGVFYIYIYIYYIQYIFFVNNTSEIAIIRDYLLSAGDAVDRYIFHYYRIFSHLYTILVIATNVSIDWRISSSLRTVGIPLYY